MNLIKKDYILKYTSDSKNTGQSEVQIALLSYKINDLKKHFAIHKKDNASKRGLLNIVSKRRKLLNYLKKLNISRYNNIVIKLKLRH
ncbi:30S ribosomal protein S15 [Buchnera aphidicola (Pterocallis alni)]|uniref:30S ribosomal protein S15 n=1 Tax=Buchnera aphidicola TaxID=9 RepID=UPI0034640B0B